MFRSTVLPAIVTVWGIAIVLNTLLNGVHGSDSYLVGQYIGAVFGVAIAVWGIRALVKARGT